VNDAEKLAAINAKLVNEGQGHQVRLAGKEYVMVNADDNEVLAGDLNVMAYYIIGVPL
jgi:hypothetical protein